VNRRTVIAALCLLASTGAFGRDPYGLLFTTPAQRAQLDNRFNTGTGHNAGSATGVSEAAQAPRSLTLNGTLISNTGRQEVWINGHRQLTAASGTAPAVRVLGPDVVQVRPTPSAKSRPMKPGQVMDTTTGAIREAYTGAANNQDK
jgi:hypothetical protein